MRPQLLAGCLVLALLNPVGPVLAGPPGARTGLDDGVAETDHPSLQPGIESALPPVPTGCPGCLICIEGEPCVPLDCSDDDPCTLDWCDPSWILCCRHRPISGTPCAADANPCTYDVCQQGDCTHDPQPGASCDVDPEDCVEQVCAPDGSCVDLLLDGQTCGDDGEECTVDDCIDGVCIHALLPDGTICSDDGEPCTLDECRGGVCDHPVLADCTSCGTSEDPTRVCCAGQCQSLSLSSASLDPSSIAADSGWWAWPGDQFSVAHLDLTWQPCDCGEDVEIAAVDWGEYSPHPDSPGTLWESLLFDCWIYRAFIEPVDQLHPELVGVTLSVLFHGCELGQYIVSVRSIHDWLTHPHKHGPGQPPHAPDNGDFMTDFLYLYTYKYAGIPFAAGPGFSDVQISANDCVPCGWVGCVYACTQWDRTVEFGRSTFTGSENQAISIIGHERSHTSGWSECEAYSWEVAAQHCTGIDEDNGYLQDVLAKQAQFCGP